MKIGKGYRTQAGLPTRSRIKGLSTPNGLLLRGVVLATYVTDDPSHPRGDNENNPPSAVYCDVLVYSSLAYNRWFTLAKVLVTQKRGGIHNDETWKPRATSKNVATDFNDTVGSNPGSLDGDHVLIGFLNNSFDEPLILKGLPHPSRDKFNEPYDSGKRLKLKAIDGDPNFVKHHGVFSGVDDLGNFIVDSTFGNDGSTDEDGKEPEPDITGTSGNQEYSLPKKGTYSVALKDMSNPASPTDYAKLSIKESGGNLEFKVNGTNSITVDNTLLNATLTLGDGSAKVAIADLLEILWASMVAVFASHTHTLDIPGGGTLVPETPMPPWNSQINSDKLTIPFN